MLLYNRCDTKYFFGRYFTEMLLVVRLLVIVEEVINSWIDAT